MIQPVVGPRRLGITEWLVCGVAALGFAFDTYELLMMPLIARPALAQLLQVDPYTASGNAAILDWTASIMVASAICGGIFGLLGGYLTDRFGRRRVLVWSILLYAVSAFAAGFSTSPWMLLVLRCTTFIGVCVEFVAAVAWLAELFPEGKQREAVLGYTQAFSSIGGLMVTGMYWLIVQYAEYLPPIYGNHEYWRYTLISGLIPAIPLIVIRPFLPESPAWKQKRAAGTLKRPSVAQLFAPQFRRTTIVTTIMFACSLGVAFGALQLTPQMVPGLVPRLREMVDLQQEYESQQQAGESTTETRERIDELREHREVVIAKVQSGQEIGGLTGRVLFAALVVWIGANRLMIRLFLVPGLIIVPLVYAFPAVGNLDLLPWGVFLAGLFTIAQLSFWGNYLPRVYPVYLRGTGESFAANVGGRMIGTLGTLATTQVAKVLPLGATPFAKIAYAAALVSFVLFLISFIASFWLPQPSDDLEE